MMEIEEPGDPLVDKVQDLSDIELALILCLVAEQHCIIEAEKESLDAVQQELKLVRAPTDRSLENADLGQVASKVLGLTWAVLDCNEHTTLDDFGSGILVKEDGEDYFGSGTVRPKGEVGHRSVPSLKFWTLIKSHEQHSSRPDSPRASDRRGPRSPQPFSPLDSRKIANVVVALNLNRASSQVQVQALEVRTGIGSSHLSRTANLV